MTVSAILNLSIPVTPSLSPVTKGRAQPQAFKKSPASVGLFSMNSPLSTYRGVSAPIFLNYNGAEEEQHNPGALYLFRVKEGII